MPKWRPNQFRMVIKGDFKVLLPEFEILDPHDQSIPADYTGKIIFLALLLNDCVPDVYLETISKSYASAISQLRKLIQPYNIKIARVRGTGYKLL